MRCNSSSAGDSQAVARATRTRRRPIALICCTASLLFVFLTANSSAQSTHDRAYWRAIKSNKYAVPANESADILAHEISVLLASPDPELRDDLAYSILTSWIYRRTLLSTSTLQSLTDEWRANLKSGIGETGTNSVLKRSFSALCLSSMAERELQLPFFGADRYHQLVADAVTYLKDERDLRGYDAKLGWIHATAHTSDLLKALAAHSLLTAQEEGAILAALGERISSAPQVYTQGEQDRVAAAVLAVIQRPDFDPAAFQNWLTRLQDADKNTWTDPLTPETLARYQNHTYTLQALVVRLSLEPDSPRLTEFRQQVLKILKSRD